MAKFEERLATSADDRQRLLRKLAECEHSQTRLAAAVASGGELASLVAALKATDEREQFIRQRLADIDRPSPLDDGFEERLAAAVKEWRGSLSRQVADARQILGKLLPEKLTVTRRR